MNQSPPKNISRQLTTSKQLLEALSERANVWEHNFPSHAAAPAAPEPGSTAQQHPATAPGASDETELNEAAEGVSINLRSPHPVAGKLDSTAYQQLPHGPSAPGGAAGFGSCSLPYPGSIPLGASPSQVHGRRQLLLLQQALFPLTRSHQADAALADDDLRPHATPKAKEIYDTLVVGVQRRPWYMLPPEGIVRVLWDLLLFVFTTGLVIYVPILIAFYASMAECKFFADGAGEPAFEPNVPPPTRGGVTFMTLTNAAFLLDIFVNFITGAMTFNSDTGLYETSYVLVDTATKYAKTWLVIDIVSCLPMECMLTAAGVGYNYNLGHLNRLLKASALLRRAHGDPFRVLNHIPAVKRNFNYSLRLVVVSFSMLLLCLHYFACALWLVLRVQSFPSQTWPVQLGIVTGEHVYQQWTWSLFAVTSAMIGLGYGSYPPVTFPEAVLWIMEMICMAGGFAVVNGFIFSAILEYLSDKSRYKAQMVRATKEVEHRRLSPALADRVIAYYKLKHSRHSAHMPIASIMADLEPGLRLQVALATVGRLLQSLPVLRECPQLLQRVALLMEPQVAAEGQLVAIPGSTDSHMYILTRGYADVYMNNLLIDTLVPGDSFCEAALLPVPPIQELPPRLRALWSGGRSFSIACWPTLFLVKALSNCNLMVLSRSNFTELLKEYQWAQDALLDLAVCYAHALAQLPMLEDLWHSAEAFDPISERLALTNPVGSAVRLQQQSAAVRMGCGNLLKQLRDRRTVETV